MNRTIQNIFVLAVSLAAVLACSCLYADGVQDNQTDNVRRVPRLGIEVPDTKRVLLEKKIAWLQAQLEKLSNQDDQDAVTRPVIANLLPDIEIFVRAARGALQHQEFFKKQEIDDALALLDRGRRRAIRLSQIAAGTQRTTYWTEKPTGGLVVRGYQSKIDHTVQPYGLVLPKSYSHDSGKGYRLDVWFHGRGETMSENVFLTQRMKKPGVFAPRDTIVLHPYGRYSNAFKFAGEVDVLEAIEHVRKNYNIDDDRISVRGFSMGGAACWQFAVHYADRWFAANPGAGFSETPEFLKFFQKETLNPTWYEEKLWRMYDCNLWAKNLLHCPTVAYSGEIDIQKQAADIMETALEKLDVKLVHVIGPQTGHKYHPDAAQEVTRRLDQLAVVGRDRMPRHVDLVTYTLKYNCMHWVTVDALEQHWEAATVSADIQDDGQIDVIAKNVTQLTLDVPAGAWPFPITKMVKVFINGKGVDVVRPWSDRSLQLTVHASGDDWELGPLPSPSGMAVRKQHDLQGPIDDAMMDSFIFVRPTGTTENKAIASWANSEMERAIEHWRRHFRGDARVKDDIDITEADMATANLVLWGDPNNNKLLGRIADKLPISWDTQGVHVGEQDFSADHHALIAIQPNPLAPDRYVVLNSSFTFREFAYLNNARQVAKLPDWAVIDVRTPPNSLWPGKVVEANFFDETWQLKPNIN